MPKEKWMQTAFPKETKGALHRQLGIPPDHKIPKNLLTQIVNKPIGSHADHHTITPLMKKRANAALNARR